MKKIILSLFILMYLQCNCFSDTICYWHVSLNKNILKQFNEITESPLITIIRSDVNQFDSLTIRFYKDTPCNDCKGNLLINNDHKVIIEKASIIGTFSPLTINLFELINSRENKISKYFEFYYYEKSRKFERYILKLIIK